MALTPRPPWRTLVAWRCTDAPVRTDGRGVGADRGPAAKAAPAAREGPAVAGPPPGARRGLLGPPERQRLAGPARAVRAVGDRLRAVRPVAAGRDVRPHAGPAPRAAR